MNSKIFQCKQKLINSTIHNYVYRLAKLKKAILCHDSINIIHFKGD